MSLSLDIRLHTCSTPRLRYSSLSTTSEKCCSVWRKSSTLTYSAKCFPQQALKQQRKNRGKQVNMHAILSHLEAIA